MKPDFSRGSAALLRTPTSCAGSTPARAVEASADRVRCRTDFAAGWTALRVLAALRTRALSMGGIAFLSLCCLLAGSTLRWSEVSISPGISSSPGFRSCSPTRCRGRRASRPGGLRCRDRRGVARVPPECPVPRDGPRSPARRLERAARGDAPGAGRHGLADRHQGRPGRATAHELHLGERAGRRTVQIVAVLVAFGVYLGRVQRWNSWTLIEQPRALLHAAQAAPAQPGHVVVALFGTLLFAVGFSSPIARSRVRLHPLGAAPRAEQPATHASRPDGAPDPHSRRRRARRPNRESRVVVGLLRLRRLAAAPRRSFQSRLSDPCTTPSWRSAPGSHWERGSVRCSVGRPTTTHGTSSPTARSSEVLLCSISSRRCSRHAPRPPRATIPRRCSTGDSLRSSHRREARRLAGGRPGLRDPGGAEQPWNGQWRDPNRVSDHDRRARKPCRPRVLAGSHGARRRHRRRVRPHVPRARERGCDVPSDRLQVARVRARLERPWTLSDRQWRTEFAALGGNSPSTELRCTSTSRPCRLRASAMSRSSASSALRRSLALIFSCGSPRCQAAVSHDQQCARAGAQALSHPEFGGLRSATSSPTDSAKTNVGRGQVPEPRAIAPRPGRVGGTSARSERESRGMPRIGQRPFPLPRISSPRRVTRASSVSGQ